MPARIWAYLFACVAGPFYLDTGQISQFITYLLIIYLPTLVLLLLHLAVPDDPQSRRFLMATVLRGTSFPFGGYRGPIRRRRTVKLKPGGQHHVTTTRQSFRAHLFALALASLKVGCRVESSFRGPLAWWSSFRSRHGDQGLGQMARMCALNGVHGNPLTDIGRFDTDSFPIRVDNHASYCMANAPHLFEDLVLSNVGTVDGINNGLAVKGMGTFKFRIADDSGGVHVIRIPNSLDLPKLEMCLLSPQHWAQEAGDGQTWMINLAHCCVLHWIGGHARTVPFNKSSNTPIFYTAPSANAYKSFVSTFEAMEAPFFRKETTLLRPPGYLREQVIPEEFVADEDLHRGALPKSVKKVVHEDDETVRMANLPLPPAMDEAAPSLEAIRHGPLTFDPRPPEAEEEGNTLAAANPQAELMRWHYRLGHLSFSKLKQLAINGEIPKNLSTVPAPKCAGCLFGAMTKLPWRGKEYKSSHKVFVATKLGESVSVDQMISTELGFFAQLKGALTKKRYRCCTIFVDHYSRLRFVHLQIDDSSAETIIAKQAFILPAPPTANFLCFVCCVVSYVEYHTLCNMHTTLRVFL